MSTERQTEIAEEEIEENDFYADDDWGEGCCEDSLDEEDEDEPLEREYCD